MKGQEEVEGVEEHELIKVEALILGREFLHTAKVC